MGSQPAEISPSEPIILRRPRLRRTANSEAGQRERRKPLVYFPTNGSHPPGGARRGETTFSCEEEMRFRWTLFSEYGGLR